MQFPTELAGCTSASVLAVLVQSPRRDYCMACNIAIRQDNIRSDAILVLQLCLAKNYAHKREELMLSVVYWCLREMSGTLSGKK